MTYTWGYLKENILSKLNMDEEQANQLGFLSRFPYYANEAMTQICSAIKPHEVFLTIEVYDEKDRWHELTKKYGVYLDKDEPISDGIPVGDPREQDYRDFWADWKATHFVNKEITFPEDFIGFSDDCSYYKGYPICLGGIPLSTPKFEEVGDEHVEYVGYNQVICHMAGTYKIPYNARWFFFTKDCQNYTVITAPADICDAIPSYVVSQCYKIDDEAKAAIYRNEFEMACARIDDTTFKSQRTMHIGGGW